MGKRKQAPPPVVTKEQYDAMTPAERRVALARDVLVLLDARILSVGSVYLWEDEREHGAGVADVDDFIANPRCEVCARGALMVAWARTADEFQRRGITNTVDLYKAARDGRHGLLEEVFGGDVDLFEEVENAFEGYEAYDASGSGAHPAHVKWWKRHRTPTARLRAICRNLIENNGELRLVPAGAS